MGGMTLTEFVTARLDEWEQEAHRKWTMREGTDLLGFGPQIGGEGYYTVETTGGERTMSYDELNAEYMDPSPDTERLAQVAAMRAIVELHQPPATTLSGPEWVGCFTCIDNPRDPKPCPTVHALAAIWRDHEDYDPAWAPEGE